MTAFSGFMHSLERLLALHDCEIFFDSVGVICHRHEPQVSSGSYPRRFHLKRNPMGKGGSPAAIVEEGRTHLEITLVFAVRGAACESGDARQQIGQRISEILPSMRIAGGSIRVSAPRGRRHEQPRIIPVAQDSEQRNKQFRKLLLGWLPGFTLVSRDNLLEEHRMKMQASTPHAGLLDAWLDLSRLNIECHRNSEDAIAPSGSKEAAWEARRHPGWLVPIPVGFGALSPLYEPGTVAAARDGHTPFRFVESLYSLGQWVSPHRLSSPGELMWRLENESDNGRYRLYNNFEQHHHGA